MMSVEVGCIMINQLKDPMITYKLNRSDRYGRYHT